MTPISVALALVTVSLPLVLCSVTGCAQDEYETRDAAFPQPIGYTPPPSAPPQPSQYASAAPAAPTDGVVDPSGTLVAPPQSQDAAEDVIGAPDGTPGAGGVVEGYDGQQAPEPEYSDTDPAALTDFRDALDPYGTWTEDPTYGTVWVPSPSAVGEDFTPYVSAGHWVYDDDYTWVSDYGWGWAPFHYGRWAWNDGLGWEWIPGRRYAGAWVSWRYGMGDWGYVGWAPLGPTWCWRHGSAVGLGFVPRMPYAFVGTHELFSPHVGGRLVTGPQAGVVAAHTQPYSPASSTVGGRIVARPTVGGPPPTMLNLAPSAVAHGSLANPGAMLARAYSRPSTAVAQGARPPNLPNTRNDVVARAQGAGSPGRFAGSVTLGRAPVVNYSPPGSSFRPRSGEAGEVPHFGGRLGGGFAGTAVANAPGYGRAVSPAVSRPYFGTPAVAPTYRAPGGMVSQAPRFSGAPSYRAPSVSRPSGGYSGGFSRPSGGYSGSQGGGGFRGGGGSSFHGSSGGSRGGGGRR